MGDSMEDSDIEIKLEPTREETLYYNDTYNILHNFITSINENTIELDYEDFEDILARKGFYENMYYSYIDDEKILKTIQDLIINKKYKVLSLFIYGILDNGFVNVAPGKFLHIIDLTLNKLIELGDFDILLDINNITGHNFFDVNYLVFSPSALKYLLEKFKPTINLFQYDHIRNRFLSDPEDPTLKEVMAIIEQYYKPEDHFADELHERLCLNEFSDIAEPYVVTKQTIYLPYYYNILPTDFNLEGFQNFLNNYENKEYPKKVLKLTYFKSNYGSYKVPDRGLKPLTVNNSNLTVDESWFKNSSDYILSLNIEDLLTIYGYTFRGDKLANFYLYYNGDREQFYTILNRDLLKRSGPLLNSKEPIVIFSENEYLRVTNTYLNEVYFPLFVQANYYLNNINKYSNVKEHLIDFDYKEYKNFSTLIEKYQYLIKNINKFSLEFWYICTKDYIAKLETIVNNAPTINKDMVVYKGISENKYNILSQLQNNSIFENKTFFSTSLNIGSAMEFLNNNCCLNRIILNEGTKCIFMDGLTQHSNEHEVLLGLDNTFRVINKDYITYIPKVLQDELNIQGTENPSKPIDWKPIVCDNEPKKIYVFDMEKIS